jgi:hypothetical protein
MFCFRLSIRLDIMSVMNRYYCLCCFLIATLGWSCDAFSQHLWWNLKDHPNDTVIYGQITVLATHENIYYCGANWHPGEPAGGYCGIQHNNGAARRTIFSIWDTSPTLHPVAWAGDPRTTIKRFGGEGEGGHTDMLWPWKIRQMFEFCVRKVPGTDADTTDAHYYIFDIEKNAWIESAVITSPNGGHKSVATIGGGLNSFLENYSGKDREAPKLAIYRLWMGQSITAMKPLTVAKGDGKWGRLHDAFFLAAGDDTRLGDIFSSLQDDYGTPVFPVEGKTIDPLPETPINPDVVKALGKTIESSK